MKLLQKIKAFTLVELIIVVSIIAVLASLAFMVLSGETAQARDAKRQADLTTFENAIATANSKNKKINYADLGVKQASITTNSGEIFPIRGAYLVEIKEGLFSTDIIATIPRDPKGAKYLGAFLSNNEYQLFATLENPATKIETALVKGTFKNGSILDILMEDLDDTDTVFKVANPTRFIAGDKITIDDEEMTVVSFNTTTSELTVTRVGTKKVHNKQAVIKLKTAVSGGDSLVVYNKINTVWTAMTGVAATGVKADATDGATIINESTNTPYIVSLSKSGNSASSSSSSSSSSGAPVATCSDGIQNQTETGVDCGGTCTACATCSDGIQNQTETGVDCGGTCPACFVCGAEVNYAGETYPTVQIGTQCWFAKNLNVGTMLASPATMPTNNATIEKWCNGSDDSGHTTSGDCATYGGLYSWDEMMGYTTTAGAQGICPTGWHIPTDTEWYTLESGLATGSCIDSRTVGGCISAGTALKILGSSGFEGFLTGTRNINNTFNNRGVLGHFWSSSESDQTAWQRDLHLSTTTVYRELYYKATGISVRCLKN